MERTALSSTQALGQVIDKFAPISLESVDFELHNPPEFLQMHIGDTAYTIGRVETEAELHNVPQIETLLRTPDDDERAFMSKWAPEETAHANIFAELLSRIGMRPYEYVARHVGRQIELAGQLAKISSLQRVFDFVYNARGAQHEQMTSVIYRKFDEKLRRIGETAFAETALRQIRPQEGRHLNFYRAKAQEIWHQMGVLERQLAKAVLHYTYRPVGIENEEHEEELARVVQQLEVYDVHEVAKPVERVTKVIMGENTSTLYIARSIGSIISPRPELQTA